jgi:hypothetical protein
LDADSTFVREQWKYFQRNAFELAHEFFGGGSGLCRRVMRACVFPDGIKEVEGHDDARSC